MNQKEIHEIAVKRGQWDSKSFNDAIVDMYAEVGELADSKGKMSNESYFEELKDGCGFVEAYKMCVAGTMQDELSDIVQLAYSIAEHYNIELDPNIKRKIEYNKLRK